MSYLLRSEYEVPVVIVARVSTSVDLFLGRLHPLDEASCEISASRLIDTTAAARRLFEMLVFDESFVPFSLGVRVVEQLMDAFYQENLSVHYIVRAIFEMMEAFFASQPNPLSFISMPLLTTKIGAQLRLGHTGTAQDGAALPMMQVSVSAVPKPIATVNKRRRQSGVPEAASMLSPLQEDWDIFVAADDYSSDSDVEAGRRDLEAEECEEDPGEVEEEPSGRGGGEEVKGQTKRLGTRDEGRPGQPEVTKRDSQKAEGRTQSGVSLGSVSAPIDITNSKRGKKRGRDDGTRRLNDEAEIRDDAIVDTHRTNNTTATMATTTMMTVRKQGKRSRIALKPNEVSASPEGPSCTSPTTASSGGKTIDTAGGQPPAEGCGADETSTRQTKLEGTGRTATRGNPRGGFPEVAIPIRSKRKRSGSPDEAADVKLTADSGLMASITSNRKKSLSSSMVQLMEATGVDVLYRKAKQACLKADLSHHYDYINGQVKRFLEDDEIEYRFHTRRRNMSSDCNGGTAEADATTKSKSNVAGSSSREGERKGGEDGNDTTHVCVGSSNKSGAAAVISRLLRSSKNSSSGGAAATRNYHTRGRVGGRGAATVQPTGASSRLGGTGRGGDSSSSSSLQLRPPPPEAVDVICSVLRWCCSGDYLDAKLAPVMAAMGVCLGVRRAILCAALGVLRLVYRYQYTSRCSWEEEIRALKDVSVTLECCQQELRFVAQGKSKETWNDCGACVRASVGRSSSATH
eukprot:GHVU01225148.1.p1 GENE.GHVU01225148.1~~GHVU01225148.1.p1  ORF type:complete len:827 (+),score=109.04 GHVU01225148.1:251-2482(+)